MPYVNIKNGIVKTIFWGLPLAGIAMRVLALRKLFSGRLD